MVEESVEVDKDSISDMTTSAPSITVISDEVVSAPDTDTTHQPEHEQTHEHIHEHYHEHLNKHEQTLDYDDLADYETPVIKRKRSKERTVNVIMIDACASI